MRIPRIYTRQHLNAETTVALEPDPSHHLARVLRLSVGDQLVLFDGTGGEYPAEMVAAGKKQIEVKTGPHREVERESPLDIHLGIAVSRGERMDHVIQKSTELGVRAITPLFTGRTEVKLKGERAEKKLQHWRQIAISACEQCGRNRLPALHAPRWLDDWLDAAEADRKFVLHHRAESAGLGGEIPSSVALLVGPEGGLNEDEIAVAENAGFEALRLGPRVLRTETAPLAAVALIQYAWGDMRPA